MSPIATIARGGASRITEPRQMVARTPAEWTALWAAHAGPEEALPPVDFATSMVAAAFAGQKPSAGYGIEIVEAIPGLTGLTLVIEPHAPGPGLAAAQILTSPFHIVSVPTRTGDIAWTTRDDAASSFTPSRDTREAPAAPVLEKGSSSTGLSPRTAAALSYLAGPVSGATILMAETRNEFVRFHAWQAIAGIGGLALVVLACYAGAFLSLLVSANGVSPLVRIGTGLWIVLVAVWAVCIWQAVTGRRFRLPVVGTFAERRARVRPAASPTSSRRSS